MIDIIPVDINAKLSGMYKFSIERPDGTVRESGWIKNLILNAGLDQLGNYVSNVNTLQVLSVGTGTIPTDPAQISLQSLLAIANITNNSTVNKGAPLYQTEITGTYAFAQGAVVGNITEVGVGPDSINLFSRSLITDEKGVPTALTVVALDKLTVYYKLSIYPTLTDSTGSFIINNVTYNYVSRVCNVGSLSYQGLDPFYFSRLQYAQLFDETCPGLSTVEAQPTGYVVTSSTVTNDVYSPGTYATKGTVSFSPDQGVVSIKAIVCVFAAMTQFIVTPSIPKKNTNQLTLRFTFSWGRG